MPKPSHPRRRAGNLGINTKKFIDRTKSMTSQVNRFKKGSWDIYLEENIITEPEIRHTVLLKLSLKGSKITIKVKWQELISSKLHSYRIERSFIIK